MDFGDVCNETFYYWKSIKMFIKWGNEFAILQSLAMNWPNFVSQGKWPLIQQDFLPCH